MWTPCRRSFLAAIPAVLAPVLMPAVVRARPGPLSGPSAGFPTQDPDLVRETVLVAHFNLERIKELVTRQPTLARAAWDWGFGDWEDALGAASHVGNREIAECLLASGARPTIFSAAMFGQLDVVKAFVSAAPGIQRTKGPHGITLLMHAVAGGARAQAVADYLKTLGDADEKVTAHPLTTDQMAVVTGGYEYGSRPDERIEIAATPQGLTFTRLGHMARNLVHVGSLSFQPMGAEAVRISFTESDGGTVMTIRDPDVVLMARRRSPA